MTRDRLEDGVTELVDVDRVEVHSDTAAAPPPGSVGPTVVPGDEIEDELVPGRVVERESFERRLDGTVERRLDRVEHGPVRRRRRLFDLGPVLLIILLLALAAIAAAWYFTRANENPVPDVVGLQVDAAVARLQEDGFAADISREPDSTQPVDVVVSQTPLAGTELDEDSTVAIVASSGPGLVAVPNAVGLTEADARDRLAGDGFRVTVVEVFSDKPSGTIVAQNPAAGEELEPGSAVRLNVSKGAGSISVPTTVGQQAVDAQQLLTDAGFKVNIVDVPSIEAAGTVVAQNPSSGEAPSGSAVRLNVSNGELPTG